MDVHWWAAPPPPPPPCRAGQGVQVRRQQPAPLTRHQLVRHTPHTQHPAPLTVHQLMCHTPHTLHLAPCPSHCTSAGARRLDHSHPEPHLNHTPCDPVVQNPIPYVCLSMCAPHMHPVPITLLHLVPITLLLLPMGINSGPPHPAGSTLDPRPWAPSPPCVRGQGSRADVGLRV